MSCNHGPGVGAIKKAIIQSAELDLFTVALAKKLVMCGSHVQSFSGYKNG